MDQTEAHAITKEALMFKTDELEREVAILKAPPYIHACGSHYEGLSAIDVTIPYTSLLYSSINTEGGGRRTEYYYMSLYSSLGRIIHCVLGYYGYTRSWGVCKYLPTEEWGEYLGVTAPILLWW